MSTSATITDIVVGSSDFDILESAVVAAGLAGVLDDPNADLTVFAPTDAAFLSLAKSLGYTGNSETDAFAYLVEALTLLSGGTDPIPLLTDVLLYHVAEGSLFAADVLAADTIQTLLGAEIGVDGITLVDNDPDLDDPTLIATDVDASNGVVHVIDEVLIPADLLASNGSNGVDFVISGEKSDHIAVGRDNDFVDANGGNDYVNGGRGNDVLLGGTGDDELHGMRGNDTLRGEDGKDEIYGGLGADLIAGGNGNDTMSGGQGHDMFVFATGDDQDRVTDFQNGRDKIDLTAFGFDSYNDFQSNANVYANGKSVVIDFGGGDKLTLDDVSLHQIGASDFVFA